MGGQKTMTNVCENAIIVCGRQTDRQTDSQSWSMHNIKRLIIRIWKARMPRTARSSVLLSYYYYYYSSPGCTSKLAPSVSVAETECGFGRFARNILYSQKEAFTTNQITEQLATQLCRNHIVEINVLINILFFLYQVPCLCYNFHDKTHLSSA